MADKGRNPRTSGKTFGRGLGGLHMSDPLDSLSTSNRLDKWATIQDAETARTADMVQIPRPDATGTVLDWERKR